MTSDGIPHFDGPRLDGRVAIVTGGGTAGGGIGNGKASAILLAQAGAAVVVVDRSEELAEDTVQLIRDLGGQGMALAADVTEADQCRYVAESTAQNFGRLDILDNNVGIGSRGRVTDMDTTEWHRVMQVNVESMMLMSGACIPLMLDTAGGGSIINISSIAAIRPRHMVAYSTSKGAVTALTEAMAQDHGPEGIRVNAVAPGPVYTPMVSAAGMAEERREQRRLASMLETEGSPWDIANAVLYLASDMARYVTGQTLVVDGGVTLKDGETALSRSGPTFQG